MIIQKSEIVIDPWMPPQAIRLPTQAFTSEFFFSHSIITACIGRTQFQTHILPGAKENQVQIALVTAEKYFLTPGTKVRFFYDSKQEILRIGPVIGILSNEVPSASRPFAKQTKFFKELLHEAKQLGSISFVFSSRGIDYEHRRINGYVFEQKHWCKKVFPFPDIIYPREPGINSSSRQTRKRLEAVGCIFLNPFSLDKWKSYKALQKGAVLPSYLPETRLVNEFSDVIEMLDHHGTVYLKPVNGTQGRGIMRVTRSNNPLAYEFKSQEKGITYQFRVSNYAQLEKRLASRLQKKQYLVQEGIDLLRFDLRLADIRVVVQKDVSGQWSLTGKVFRIGKEQSITSNISSGGYASEIEEIITHSFSDPKLIKSLPQDIEQLSISVAHELDLKFGPLCELGIDIGLDRKGRLWLIEANIKPGRQVFLLTKNQAARQASVQKPMAYAIYISGFEGGRKNDARKLS